MASKPVNEEAIFKVACQLGSLEARADYLEQVCGGDDALLDRVKALLRVYDKEQSFLEAPPPGVDATIQLSPVTETPGTVIGPYKLLQKIGEGGMGVVYMARQKEPVKRDVALKIVKPGMDTEQVIARFEAERQALAMMDHPNVAQVLDAGTTDSGRPYFVMELVRGVPITDYCDQQQLSPQERLELFVSICQAVQHAHQKGIIHRDIKPSNVLIAEYDHRAVPKIIDFGVAKALHHELTEKTVFTHYGQIIGTLEYMSPEQAKLNQLDIDTRSDVYSLGVLLYELLAGSTPLTKEQLLSVGHDEMLRMIREEEPEKPSTRLSQSGQALSTISQRRRAEPKKLAALVRGDLDWIVMKALEKDRNRRYETSLGLAADVRRFLDNEPVEACPPSKLYRLRKYVSRNKAATISLGSIATAVLIGLLGITVGLWHSRMIEKAAAESSRRQAFRYGINLAFEAWNRGNRNEFETIMQHLGAIAADEERRGFNWRWLETKYEELSAAELIETSTEVFSVSYHPSGSHLAICHTGKPAMIRDCVTGDSMAIPQGLPGSSVRFSPDGTYLVAGRTGYDPKETPRLQVWRFPSFEKVTWSEESAMDLSQVVFSRDDTLLAGLSLDGIVEIREVSTGRLVAKCPIRLDSCDCLAFSPDGRFLAAASNDGTTLRLWSVTGKKLDEKSGLPNKECSHLAFTPNGDTLLTCGWFGARRWKVTEDGLGDLDWITKEASVYSVAFSREGILALGCADQTVRIWDLDQPREIARLLHTSLVADVAFSPDSRTLAAATRDRVVHLWDAHLWRAKDSVRSVTHYFPPLAVSSTGEVAAAEIRDGQHVFKLWNPRSRTERDLWTDEKARIMGAAFSPRGDRVASVSTDGTVRAGRVKTGELLPVIKAHSGTATCVAFSPDGRTLVSGGDHAELFFWDLELWSKNGKKYKPRKYKGRGWLQTSLAFSPKGHLACGSGVNWNFRGRMMVLDLSGGSPEPKHQADYPETVRCVAYSPDGTRIALTYKFSAGIVHVLDATTFERVFEFQGHSNKVTTLTFTPDSRQLITGSDDGTVRFWDLQDGKAVGTLRVGARVRNLVMPDENILITASTDGWLQAWRAAPRSLTPRRGRD
jgi:WD40 repeat protein/serine/threonine protein kinase